VSQINDALKNARKHQRDSTAKGPPLTPVRPIAARPHSHWPLGIVIVLLLIAACVVIAFALNHRPAPAIAKNDVSTDPSPHAAVAAVSVPAPLPAPAANVATSAPPVPAPVSSSAVLPAVVIPAAPKLQGIFYDPVHPTAIVSGKTVHPGDVIDGLRVKSISATTLVLVGTDKKETALTMAR
jgi:hypothetical protein